MYFLKFLGLFRQRIVKNMLLNASDGLNYISVLIIIAYRIEEEVSRRITYIYIYTLLYLKSLSTKNAHVFV